jgi:hypothetical protein
LIGAIAEDHDAELAVRHPGLEITDDELNRIEVVGDLIRLIETVDNERRRRGAAPVVHNLFGPRLARSVKPIKQQKGCEEGGLEPGQMGERALGCLKWGAV